MDPQIDQPHADLDEPPADQAGPVPGNVADFVEPMTGSLMVRLFAVPAVIVAAIVGCAVLVVVLFGSISSESERSIDQLVRVLETSRGERLVGVLLPRDKEVWQAGPELVLRLRQRESELTPAEVTEIAVRLARLLEADAGVSDQLTAEGRKRLHLLMQALAATQEPMAVRLFVDLLDDKVAETRREALMALALQTANEEARTALPAICRVADDEHAVVRMVATVLLGQLGSRDDGESLEVLKRRYVDEDREVRWNAALSLARLGDGSGTNLLADMLRRPYWQDEVKAGIRQDSGQMVEYAMPPGAVARYLAAAIDAAAHLDEATLWAQIEELESDPSPAVADKAREALAAHSVARAAATGRS
ncbi:MAG: HEAT repeat domain-containing protein [bacterium]|nr:HEAT repeat domain-containing protein [bacterium]